MTLFEAIVAMILFAPGVVLTVGLAIWISKNFLNILFATVAVGFVALALAILRDVLRVFIL